MLDEFVVGDCLCRVPAGVPHSVSATIQRRKAVNGFSVRTCSRHDVSILAANCNLQYSSNILFQDHNSSIPGTLDFQCSSYVARKTTAVTNYQRDHMTMDTCSRVSVFTPWVRHQSNHSWVGQQIDPYHSLIATVSQGILANTSLLQQSTEKKTLSSAARILCSSRADCRVICLLMPILEVHPPQKMSLTPKSLLCHADG